MDKNKKKERGTYRRLHSSSFLNFTEGFVQIDDFFYSDWFDQIVCLHIYIINVCMCIS